MDIYIYMYNVSLLALSKKNQALAIQDQPGKLAYIMFEDLLHLERCEN